MVMHWIYLHNSLINIFVLLARVTYLPNNSFHYLVVRLPYIKSYPDTSSKSFAKFIEYKDFVILLIMRMSQKTRHHLYTLFEDQAILRF